MSTNSFSQSGSDIYLWFVFGVSTARTQDQWSSIQDGGGYLASQWITLNAKAFIGPSTLNGRSVG